MEKLLWLPVLKLLPVRYKEYKEGRKVTAAAAVALSLVPSSR